MVPLLSANGAFCPAGSTCRPMSSMRLMSPAERQSLISLTFRMTQIERVLLMRADSDSSPNTCASCQPVLAKQVATVSRPQLQCSACRLVHVVLACRGGTCSGPEGEQPLLSTAPL